MGTLGKPVLFTRPRVRAETDAGAFTAAYVPSCVLSRATYVLSCSRRKVRADRGLRRAGQGAGPTGPQGHSRTKKKLGNQCATLQSCIGVCPPHMRWWDRRDPRLSRDWRDSGVCGPWSLESMGVDPSLVRSRPCDVALTSHRAPTSGRPPRSSCVQRTNLTPQLCVQTPSGSDCPSPSALTRAGCTEPFPLGISPAAPQNPDPFPRGTLSLGPAPLQPSLSPLTGSCALCPNDTLVYLWPPRPDSGTASRPL